MRLFDTHCHIADPRFDGDRDAVIQRFLDAGVRRALVVADPREEEPNQERVFALASAMDPDEWIRAITGESLNVNYYLDYLEKKYTEVYGL